MIPLGDIIVMASRNEQEPNALGIALKVILGMPIIALLTAAILLFVIGALLVPPGVIRLVCGSLFFSGITFSGMYFCSWKGKPARLLVSVIGALFMGANSAAISIKAISGVVAYRICSGIAAVFGIVLIFILLRYEWKSNQDHKEQPAL